MHFGKTFISSPYYDGTLSGFDIMIMESAETTDKIIKFLKDEIDNYFYLSCGNRIIDVYYDDTNLMLSDKNRIEKIITQYGRSKGLEVRILER